MTHLSAAARRVAPRAIVVLLLAAGHAGCDPGYSAPSSPTPLQSQPPPPPTSSRPALTVASLSGVVSEMTSDGLSPIDGVEIYCDACGEFGHSSATTDASGAYDFGREGIWLSGGDTIAILVNKDGYEDRQGSPGPSGRSWRSVRIHGDTRFDFQLVRR